MIIYTLLGQSKDDCCRSQCVKNIFIVVDHVCEGGIGLPHWATLMGSRWAGETVCVCVCICVCVCVRSCARVCVHLCVCVYTLLSCEQRSPASPLALTKLSAHTQPNSLPLLSASDDALDLAEPTWVIWITRWTKYTLPEVSERKQRFFRVAGVMWVVSPAQPSSLCKLLYWHQMPRRPGLRRARGTGTALFLFSFSFKLAMNEASLFHKIKKLCNSFPPLHRSCRRIVHSLY